MKYNKFYFLHIPKTGGRHIKLNCITPIIKKIEENGIKNIVEKNTHHNSWHSAIDEKTYIITILRDPVEQAISIFSHINSLNKDGNLLDKYDKNKLTKEHFFDWMDKNLLHPNFQAKSFLYNQFSLKLEDIKNNKNPEIIFNENIFNQRKNKVNLFLDIKNVSGREVEIQQKILLDLGIENNINSNSIVNNKNFFNPESKTLYNKFSDEEKNIINAYNKIDSDFYKNTNYF